MKKYNCETCQDTKKVIQNAGMDNEYEEDCPDCVGIKEELDMSGSTDGDR